MSDAPSTRCDVLVIGAGLSGLVASRELTAAGRSVITLDKGRSVGGRLATRRIGDAHLDHGAQFFTVRGDDFGTVVADAMAAGVVREWCRGFDDVDGYPRYAGSSGMNAVAKWLAAGLDVRVDQRVGSIAPGDAGFVVAAEGADFTAPTVLVTAPVPQSLAMIDAGGTALDPDVDAQLRDVSYFATLALLVTLDGAPAVPAPGGVQLAETDAFTFVGDNQAKGISPSPAVTFHANHDYSSRRYDDDPDDVRDELTELARPWFGDAAPREIQLKKWRYAGPVDPVPSRCLVDHGADRRLVFAGDAFGGPKVEGAFNSGLAAARAILEA